ncbi:MAG: Gfo/Idh/MocA family oxidoreductase [Planctomycetaceae bacterium]|jgi:predicted dehydrogenase|nr:Gfo/Idh/MocA family oxidoreductase [Planctomycetaceae bacterium]
MKNNSNISDMSKAKISRRHVLKASAIFGSGILFLPNNILAHGQSPNEKLSVAFIGLGGQGKFQLDNIGDKQKNLVNVVALCDVDDVRAGDAYKRFEKAQKFQDFRVMFDKLENSIDAVTVSTPDHTHYHPVIRAIRAGKHVYCEKPLAHSVAEIRIITSEAARMKVATQLGCQRHAYRNMARVVELIKSGAIGDVTEVHSWIGTDRGMPAKPDGVGEPPSTLDWQNWLGPCPTDWKFAMTGNKSAFVPYNWRFWWDFGTGETGNWSCHILDLPFWALDLKYPIKVSASGQEVDVERTPKAMEVVYDFPARGGLPALKLYWSHTKKPACFEKFNIKTPVKNKENKDVNPNNLFVGTKGMIFAGFDRHALLPESDFKDFEYPKKMIPDSPGFHLEWINACKGGEPATCNFAYSGPMAEAAILGNTAFKAGHKTFEWDAENLIAKNCPEVQNAIKPDFRKGWEY